jgi:hypothetical protein
VKPMVFKGGSRGVSVANPGRNAWRHLRLSRPAFL